MNTSALKINSGKDYFVNFDEMVNLARVDDSSLSSLSDSQTSYLKQKLLHDPVVLNPEKNEYKSKEVFNCIQKWEGIILSIENNSIYTRLYDISNRGFEEEAEIPIDEISDDDHELISEGAVFYWSLGYLKKKNGQKVRQSIIKFRRLPVWHKSEIISAQNKASIAEAILGTE